MIEKDQSTITDGWGNEDTILNIEGVEGTQHDDIIIGNSGNNSLDGRYGNNQINGGPGFDYIEYNGSGRENVNVDMSTSNIYSASDLIGAGINVELYAEENITGLLMCMREQN